MKMISDAKRKANAKYNAKTRITVSFQLNKSTDQDIIEYLKTVDNVNGFLKNLVREQIKKDGKE